MTTRSFRRVQATDESHSVTTLELLFDLVFVFAFTQVTQLMADNPTPTGALRGLVLLALLWWARCSYAWLGNQANAEEGVVRLTVIVALGESLAALYIGVVVHLLGHVALRRRNVGSWNIHRTIAAVMLVLLLIRSGPRTGAASRWLAARVFSLA